MHATAITKTDASLASVRHALETWPTSARHSSLSRARIARYLDAIADDRPSGNPYDPRFDGMG